MNVLMLSPGFPTEMNYFARALAARGARVFGVGDPPPEGLPEVARRALTGYRKAPLFGPEDASVEAILPWAREQEIERIVCLWEPGVILAARLREALGIPGMTVEESRPFRDKVRMKDALEKAGIRTPRHERARTPAEARKAAKRIGFPLIVKPVDGAGSADTYRVNSRGELDKTLPRLEHLPEMNIEEFIDGEEYTFDTLCIEGEIVYYSMTWYRPRPLIARTEEWISPQIVMLRDVEAPALAGGRAMGRAALEALGFRTGLTHMEWFLEASGEVVFGEIAARPPGAHSIDVMNYASDIDLYDGFAEASLSGTFSQKVERKYNAAIVYKRAQGRGNIQRIDGLEAFLSAHREHVAAIDLIPPGQPRRDWRQTLLSDGFLVVRHPDLEEMLRLADAVGTEIQIFAQ